MRLPNATTMLLPLLFLLPNCSAPEEEEDDTAIEADLTKEPGRIYGTWKSPECEPAEGAAYQKRTYRMAANGIFATWERYASPTCQAESKLFTIQMGGSSTIDRLSRSVRHTFEIRVFIDERSIEPASAAGVAYLERICPVASWRIGHDTDVTSTGCGAIVPKNAECPVEYDLLYATPLKLRFGSREHPLCTEATRPAQLSPWAVRFDHAF